MIVWKYILLFTCLGIGVALCVGAISILRSSSRQRATCLVRGGAWRDVLLGSFCAGALEEPIKRGRAHLPRTAPRDS